MALEAGLPVVWPPAHAGFFEGIPRLRLQEVHVGSMGALMSWGFRVPAWLAHAFGRAWRAHLQSERSSWGGVQVDSRAGPADAGGWQYQAAEPDPSGASAAPRAPASELGWQAECPGGRAWRRRRWARRRRRAEVCGWTWGWLSGMIMQSNGVISIP